MISNPHLDGISSLTVSKNNRYLVSGGKDGSVKVYELETGKEVIVFHQAHIGSVISLAIFDDSDMIASGSMDGQVKTFSLRNKMIKTIIKKAGILIFLG